MKDQVNQVRLTDELERELMMKAIEDQFRFKPGVALKGLFVKGYGLLRSAFHAFHASHASRTVAHS